MVALGSAMRAFADSMKHLAHELVRHRMVRLRPPGAPKGRVLLSYTTAAFAASSGDGLSRRHSNLWECADMARAFLERGYAVDVMDYDDALSRPRGEYAAFVDIHGNMERLGPSMPSGCLKMMHLTGSHWLFQNMAEYERLWALAERRGVVLQPRRLQRPSFGIELADCATLLGNDVTMSTWAFARKPIRKLPVTSPVTYDWPPSKDFEQARKRFVWLGGTGLVLKGLDLVLEAFSQMPELRLTVCGPVSREPDFVRAYRKELYQTPNIKCVDWVDVGSPQFLAIVEGSGAFVYPTASEGASVAVVTCLHAGLVPIVSDRTGIDIGEFGFVLDESSVESVMQAVRHVAQLPPERLEAMARGAYEHARTRHSREAFSKAYRAALDEFLGEGLPR